MFNEPLTFTIVVVSLLLVASINMFLTNKKASYNITLASIIISIILLIPYSDYIHSTPIYADVFNHMLIFDTFSTLFSLLILFGALLTLVIGKAYMFNNRSFTPESFSLFLFAIFAMVMLNSTAELFSIFVSLEIASIAIYILVGLQRDSARSSEAYYKYLLLGAFSGSFFLLGILFILLQTQSTHIAQIALYAQSHNIEQIYLLVVGGVLLMIALMFKVAAIPFGFWVIEVYDGASLPVTAFMAGAFKIAIFALILRLFIQDFITLKAFYDPMLVMLALITLIAGSLLAVAQKRLKRMLAASSIVHTGYMLIALASLGKVGSSAAPSVSFYLIAYFLSATGAFGILSYISKGKDSPITYDSIKGLAKHNPLLALFLSIFMLSLAGFPSTIGFLGKFYIFTGAIEAGNIFLASIGILAAFVSIYYYFKVIANIYFYKPTTAKKRYEYPLTFFAIAISAIAVLWGGIGTGLITFLPGADLITRLAHDAILSLQL